MDIKVGRYQNAQEVGYQGWIEPKDKSWIMFIGLDGTPTVYLNRDEDGGVITDQDVPDFDSDEAVPVDADAI